MSIRFDNTHISHAHNKGAHNRSEPMARKTAMQSSIVILIYPRYIWRSQDSIANPSLVPIHSDKTCSTSE